MHQAGVPCWYRWLHLRVSFLADYPGCGNQFSVTFAENAQTKTAVETFTTEVLNVACDDHPRRRTRGHVADITLRMGVAL